MTAKFCPFAGGDCLEHQCNFYVQHQGKNLETGEMNPFMCSFLLERQNILELLSELRSQTATYDKLDDTLRSIGRGTAAMFAQAAAEKIAELGRSDQPEVLPREKD